MSNLADAEDLATLLGLALPLSSTDEALLEQLLDRATTIFETAVNRADSPFGSGRTGLIEIYEGQGSRRLVLNYPIKAVTSVVIGRDLSAPEVTLDVTDPLVVMFRGRELLRNDGLGWKLPSHHPSFVKIVYNSLDDVPTDATEAVLSLAGMMYQRVGIEGLKSETLDNYSASFLTQTDFDTEVPGWTLAVEHHKRLLATF
jgi:hypothetical protein